MISSPSKNLNMSSAKSLKSVTEQSEIGVDKEQGVAQLKVEIFQKN